MENKLIDSFTNKISEFIERIDEMKEEVDILSTRISEKIQEEGRVIFVGAGISADMAKIIIDEMWFNFQIEDNKFISVTAAKSYADSLKKWKELEEMPSVSVFELGELNLNKNDLVIGLSSSGKTEYVISAVEFASKYGCETGFITDINETKIEDYITYKINTHFSKPTILGLNTAEGSTVQKMTLDFIIYTAMEKAGRIYNNHLVFMKPVSMKIERYCIETIVEILSVDKERAKELLYNADKRLEVCLVSNMLNISNEEAESLLKTNNYNFVKTVGN